MPYVTPLREDSWKLMYLAFSGLPFADFALCLFNVINPSHDYEYALSPESFKLILQIPQIPVVFFNYMYIQLFYDFV